MYETYSKSTVDKAIGLLKNYLTSNVTLFATNLDKWITRPITVNKDNINEYGPVTIDDWSISGLTLKSINLDFIKVRTDQTQNKWAEQTATALGTIFCSKGTFAQGRINLSTGWNLTMYINPADFDNFVSNDSKLSDISTYISEKINNNAKKEHIITNNISTSLNGLWYKNPNLSNSGIVTKVDDKTFKIIRGRGRMISYNYLKIFYEYTSFACGNIKSVVGDNLSFNNWIIKRADTDVW
ncbi:hypothetical protein [Spiroplasma endosymbiont of Nebria brevicollis]|uniref:hypothetical protein n=1 Tax=Spiroplasma endosymbiont of Nebria brevicollis TaxID=3066284 RepID=UPI00313D18C7